MGKFLFFPYSSFPAPFYHTLNYETLTRSDTYSPSFVIQSIIDRFFSILRSAQYTHIANTNPPNTSKRMSLPVSIISLICPMTKKETDDS